MYSYKIHFPRDTYELTVVVKSKNKMHAGKVMAQALTKLRDSKDHIPFDTIDINKVEISTNVENLI